MKTSEKLEEVLEAILSHFEDNGAVANLLVDAIKDVEETEKIGSRPAVGTLKAIIWAYDHRNDSMAHIPGHPGSEAFFNAKINQAKEFLEELKTAE